MKKILFSLVFSVPFGLAAQSQSLSIAALWDSLNTSSGYQQDLIRTQISREGLKELRTNRIPVFYLDANLQRNLIIPTTPVPAIAFDQTAEDGAVIPLQFATKWSSKAGIQVEWNIFDPKRKREEQAQALDISLAEIEQQRNGQNWRRDAVLAYTSVVLATQQYELARQDSAAYDEIRQLSKVRYEAGRESASSYSNAQQEFERKKIQLYEAWSVLLDADLELQKFVDLSGTRSLTSDILEIRGFVGAQSLENYDIRSLEVEQQISLLQKENIKRQLLPTLSLNAYWGEQYFSNELRLDRKDEWFGNSFVNLAMRIPISAYFALQPSLRQATLDYSLASEQIAEEKRRDALDTKQLGAKIQSAQQKIKSLEKIEQLALAAKSEIEAAYRAGRVLVSEYNQSSAAYNQAKRDVWQATYDLIDLMLEPPANASR